MQDKFRFEKLLEAHKEHGKIIIGVDFDDTIFPLNQIYANRCANTRKLLQDLKEHAIICLYTVADEQSLKYKVELMRLWGITPDHINKSPVKLGDGGKPFFNVLLDDKAGLIETYNLLLNFKNQL